MKYHNEKEQSWRRLLIDYPETAKAISESDKREFLCDAKALWVIDHDEDMCKTIIYRAPIIEKKPLSFEDIKQGDALSGDGGKTVCMITEIHHLGVFVGRKLHTFEQLSKENGSRKIRSIGEADWRHCYK